MACFDRVPVVDVHQDNFRDFWPSMVHAVTSATFISIDTELSGLGEKKLLRAHSVDDRYKGTTESAKTRSIVSLGISCFSKQSPTPPSSLTGEKTKSSRSSDRDPVHRYLVNTFNITVLCQENYVVEPASLKFLADHGFDFHKQYTKGLPYYRGTDQEGTKEYQCVRQLFVEILSSRRPVVFHNAFVDLIFLYQNLYATLPPLMSTFLADLTEMFGGGILDTKYITDFHYRIPASYLEYVFRKCQRDNADEKLQNVPVVHLEFPTFPKDFSHLHYSNCGLPANFGSTQRNDGLVEKLKAIVCGEYAAHGWCRQSRYCSKSHDIDLILHLDSLSAYKKSRKRRRRNKKNNDTTDQTELHVDNVNNLKDDCSCEKTSSHSDMEKNEEEMLISHNCGDDLVNNKSTLSLKQNHNVDIAIAAQDEVDSDNHSSENLKRNSSMNRTVCGGHRAGFDSFMTGFILATYLARHCHEQGSEADIENSVEEFRNKIYLTSKDIPLTISKSGFSKTSKDHHEKFSHLRFQE